MCGMCGTSLASEPVAQEVRRTVTIVFCDLKGSTSLGESIDTESLREVLNLYFKRMQAVLESHGGTVEKFIGDAVMAVFGLPRLHEDDALRAVRAAMEMKEALAKLNIELEARWGVRLLNRTGVNTGEVVAGDVSSGQRLVTGDTVNTAARLEQAAPALEVVIGEPTYRLVKDFVDVEHVEPLELKGKAERVPAYRLIEARPGEAAARNLEAPMVGRHAELGVLRKTLEAARMTNQCHVVALLGPAGVGKSRLLHEFEAVAGSDVRKLRGRCLSYGDGITYWPLADIVRQVAGIANEDSLDVARTKLSNLLGAEQSDVADRVAGTVGLTTAVYSFQETFWAARRFLEIVAGGRPLIVTIEDIHWAEQTFLDLLRHIADTAEAPIVLACSARQDLL